MPICLSMIVRDEAHVIERCLDAARPLLDAIDICDTGSSDDTVARIRGWLERTRVPGRVWQDPFVDFAWNRTRALAAARETAETIGWDPADTFLLLLDADMVIEIRPDFSAAPLGADVYEVVQRNGALEYPNVRLVRASVPAVYVGPTHEYLSVPAEAAHARLPTLTIADHNDGGSRADKHARDRRLLEAELARDPANVRAMFYLAQTYHGLGDRPRAFFWYWRRARAGGWPEEAWYARYAMAVLLDEGGDARAAVRAFAEALRADPARPEPYARLAGLLRRRGHYQWALRLARAGARCGVPSDRRLFIDRHTVDWDIPTEVAIASYYTGDRAGGLDANEHVALGCGAPAGLAALARQNAIFFAEPLPGVDCLALEPALPSPFVPCNPSIVRRGEGYLVNCRAVSYRIDADQRYHALEPDGIYRTRNVLLELDRDLHVRHEAELRSIDAPIRDWVVQGLEDCRLVAGATTRDAFGFTCTTTNLHPDGPIRISLFSTGPGPMAVGHRPLRGYGDGQPQKNWLPFRTERGDLRAVYGYEPLVVLAVDENTGVCRAVVERRQDRPFDAFRGSAGPVTLPESAGGGRLLMVHTVVVHERRVYLHRFLRVDDDWVVRAASRPFYFRRLGIEFVCGACLSHAEDEVLVTLGVEDREAWLYRVPLSTILDCLRPLPTSQLDETTASSISFEAKRPQ